MSNSNVQHAFTTQPQTYLSCYNLAYKSITLETLVKPHRRLEKIVDIPNIDTTKLHWTLMLRDTIELRVKKNSSMRRITNRNVLPKGATTNIHTIHPKTKTNRLAAKNLFRNFLRCLLPQTLRPVPGKMPWIKKQEDEIKIKQWPLLVTVKNATDWGRWPHPRWSRWSAEERIKVYNKIFIHFTTNS